MVDENNDDRSSDDAGPSDKQLPIRKARKCNYVSSGGIPCGAYAMDRSDTCWFHSQDAEVVRKRQDALSLGGKSKQTDPTDIKVGQLKDPDSLRRVLQDAIAALVSGRMHPKQAGALASLSNCLLKVLEVSDLRTRLEAVEDAIRDKEYDK